jgi:sugar phosphate isomerase/epimerase
MILAPALCSVTFRTLTPDEIVALAAAAGLAAIEWGGDVHVPPGDLDRARSVRALTERHGLKVSSYGSYLQPPRDPPAAVAAALATAQALGAATIRVWAGSQGRDSADYTAAERNAVAAALRAMADAARDAGLTISLEYHRRTLTDDLASARALLAAVMRPNLHTYWQPRPGLPLGIALNELDGLAADLSHLHVFAWDDAMRRYPLADHAPYWRSVFEALRESRWQGPRYAMIEFVQDDSITAFRQDAAALRRLLAPIP